MSFLTFFILSFSIGYATFLLYYTDFVAEYGKLLGMSKLLSLEEYEIWKSKNGMIGYPLFIREKNGFGPHLVGCPICLTTFLSLVGCIFLLSTHLFLLVGAAAIAVFTVSVWGYKLLNKLMFS